MSKVRTLFPALLFAIILTSCGNAGDINSTSSPTIADGYNKSVLAAVAKLTPAVAHARDTLTAALTKLSLYKKLVTDKEVNQKYLTALTGIAMLISSNNGNSCSMTEKIAAIIESDDEQQRFVTTNLMFGTRGGLTPEIVDVYYRYRNKYKYFGDSSTVLIDANGKKERIENPYNLAIAFAVFEPNNKEVLEALYESVKSNNYSWAEKKDDPEKYYYPYILFAKSFKEHLNKVAPDSKYNFLRYKGTGSTVTAGYFEVTALGVGVTDYLHTGNHFTNKQASEGNAFLIIKATYKNIDQEGRTLLSAGSLFIDYKGKEYQFDKTEPVLADGFGVTSAALNPLSMKTTRLVFPIAKEIKGDVFWQPANCSERIYLGGL